MKCWICRGYGFVLSGDSGVTGCEEYRNCSECFGTGIKHVSFQNFPPSIAEYKRLKETKKENKKRRKIIL